MARSPWKPQHINKGFLRFLIKANLKKTKVNNFHESKKPYYLNYKTNIRSNTVTSILVKNFKTILTIHKGLFYRTLNLHKLGIGSKFGEFGFTRKPSYFPTKEKKKKNKFLRR